MDADIKATADDVIQLAELSLKFGRVDRATYQEDGKRPESDTDHTVMLSLVACSLAQKYYPHLDRGLIAQFAMVHDLVEVYAGDTPTLKISSAGKQDKARREQAALKRLEHEFSESFPLIPELLARYEARAEPEARFVKAVDKIVPKATHILNKGAALQILDITKQEAVATYKQQAKDIQTYASDFPKLLQLRTELAARMLRIVPD